jgi:hypothetical protein
VSDKFEFIDGVEVRVPDRAHVRVAVGLPLRVLRLALPPDVGDHGTTRVDQRGDPGDFRELGSDLRLPAGARGAGPAGPTGRPGVGAGATPAPAERGNSLLKTTFKALRRISFCPWRIGAITAAALVLLHHEHDRTT